MTQRSLPATILYTVAAGIILGPVFAFVYYVAAENPPSKSQAVPSKPPPAARKIRKTLCMWTDEKITIDGRLDEPAWNKAEAMSNFAVPWQGGRSAKTPSKAKLLWSNDAIYFAAEMEDADLYADVVEHNGMCWLNDVFELFFKPKRDAHGYYEFQVNAANTRLELFFPSRGSGGYQRFYKTSKHGLTSQVQLKGTLNKWEDKDAGWTVEGKIPWTGFAKTGGRPKPKDEWHFTLCRYDYSTAFEQPELSCTAPLKLADFHRYEDYGILVFTRSQN